MTESDSITRGNGRTSRRGVLKSIAAGAVGLTAVGAATTTATGQTSGGSVTSGATYKLLNAASGKALDVESASTADGANVHQWEYVGGANQQWTVEDLGNGYYKLVNENSGKALDVESASTADGANVHQWDYVGGENQQWAIEAVGDGLYRLEARHSGKVAEAPLGNYANGDNVQQWGDGGGANQRWALFEVGSPYDADVSTEPRDQWEEYDNGSTGTVVIEITNNESNAVVINPTIIGQFSSGEEVMNPNQEDLLFTAGQTKEVAIDFDRLDEAADIWIDIEADGTKDDTLQQVPYTNFGD